MGRGLDSIGSLANVEARRVGVASRHQLSRRGNLLDDGRE